MKKIFGKLLLSTLLIVAAPSVMQAQQKVTPLKKSVPRKMAENRSTSITFSPEKGSAPSWSMKTSKAARRVLAPSWKKAVKKRSAMRTASDGAMIYGSLLYKKSWESMDTYDIRPYGVYSFKAGDPNNMTQTADDTRLYANGGGYAADGVYHLVNHYTLDGEQVVTYYEYDMSDWSLITEEEGDDTYVALDLTYNPDDEQVYGIFYNEDGGYTFTSVMYDMGGYRYDINDDLDVQIVALAANSEGEIYGIGIDGNLYYIDESTGDLEEIGVLGVTPSSYLQSAAFDLSTDKLYWAAQLEDGGSAFFSVDTESGEAEKIADFDDSEEFTGLFVMEAAAESDAPEAASDVKASFEGAATTGTVTFVMPTATYGGEELAGTLNYVITANGEEVASGSAEAGAEVSAEVTVEGGQNEIVVVVSNDSGDSPEAKTSVWVSYDEPVAPTNITLTIAQTAHTATVTWTAPQKGQHDGYIDTENLTYNITRMPDGATTTGVSGTSFTETLPEGEMTTYYYQVAAVNGGVTGKAGTSNSAAAGNALEIPFEADMSNRDDFTLFSVIDSNEDSNSWEYAYVRAWYTASETKSADDWIVTPALKLNNDRTYNVEVVFAASNSACTEKIEIAMGQGDEPAKYSQLLEPTEFNSTDKLAYEEEISVSEAGDYRLGIHAMSDAAQENIYLYSVSVTEGTVYNAPDSATNLTVVPAEFGQLKADISFTTPTKTYKGEDLAAITKVVVKRDTTTIATFDAPAAGAALTCSDEGMDDGSHTYSVVAYNEYGAGRAAETEAWVGIDEPMEPQDIRIRDNGNDVTISWKAPGSVGYHGGYVIPEDLYYNVYDMEGNLLVRNIKETEYTDNTVKLTGSQRMLYYYVSATSKGGEGWADYSQTMIAGDALKLPFEEHFTNGGIDNSPWWFDDTVNNGVFTVQFATSHDEVYGSATFVPNGSKACGGLNSPKLSLSGVENPGMTFYYYAVPGKNARLFVRVSETTDDPVTLKTIDFSTLDGEEGWRREYVDLSSVKDARYVIVKFFAESDDMTNVAFDDIKISDVPANDLSISMDKPTVIRRGQNNNIEATVTNEGLEDAADITVVLYSDGEIADTKTIESLAAGESADVVFSLTPSTAGEGDVTLKAEVIYSKDSNKDNNTTEEYSITPTLSDYPTVESLTSETEGDKVTLSWNAPTIDNSQVTDDFESYTPWIMDGIGPWTVYDGDKAYTIQFSDIWIANAGKPMAFEVWDSSDEEMDARNKRKYMLSHSGNQCLVSFNPSGSTGQSADDWLISPLLSGEAQTITFFAKSMASNYLETFEVMYSATDAQPGSFVNIQTFPSVKGGLEWTEFSIALPEGAKYFAIHNKSYDATALMVDDITYTPASLVVAGYNIYRDGVFVTTVPAGTTTYTDTAETEGDHEYKVSVVYTVGESQPASVDVTTGISGIGSDGVRVNVIDGTVIVGKSSAFDAALYNMSGAKVYEGEGRSEYRITVPAGTYMLKADGQVIKIQVK